MKPVHTVFYSWQSTISKPTNLVAIRNVIREASSLIEIELDETRIEIDEATRNTTGSPNIPMSIFSKISACDVFICDLTTINTDAPAEFKRVPNPNVLIELGFAVATLGWNRIIMVFNTCFGSFPGDLPFDIDRHRATQYSIKDTKDKAGKNAFIQVMKTAIQAIIEQSPLKPAEENIITPEQRKRQIDVNNLTLSLNTIHIPTFDYFIEEIPLKIIDRIFYFKDSFVAVLDSNSFHIYDEELLRKLTNFKTNWVKSLSFAQHYGPDHSMGDYLFHIPMDTFPSKESEQDFHFLVKVRSELEQNFKDLLYYVRNNYLEVDLDDTSNKAFETYKIDLKTYSQN